MKQTVAVEQPRKKMSVFTEYVLLTAATLLIVAGNYFFKFQNHFSFGGVTGIAVILNGAFGFSTGTVNFVINMGLLVVGFFFLGKSFGIKTVYVSLLMSLGLSAAEHLVPLSGPLTSQPMLELVFGITLPALGSAILFNLGASGGGTDIIAMIIKKYSSFNIGSALFVVDLCITACTCFVFDITTGLFSFTGLMVKSLIIDGVIERLNLCKYFTIVCDRPEPIVDFLLNDLNRSATVYEAQGAYTHAPKTIILTVLKRHQAVELRNFVKRHEPTAFITITNSSEIIGKGFGGFD